MRRRAKAKFKEGDIVAFADHVSAHTLSPGGFTKDTRLVVVASNGNRYRVRSTDPVKGHLRDGWFYDSDLDLVDPI